MSAPTPAAARELARLVGAEQVLDPVPLVYLRDATEARGMTGRADAVVFPRSTEETAAVVGWCYEHDVPVVPRGGGTGFAGGCVPDGGVVLSTERIAAVRSFDPALWRIHVDAGMPTGHVRRLARENGLLYPPDPGAAEQSHIGGNVATNAGGPHAFKYGVTGRWVTGLEAVIAPGETIVVGGPVRKDVAGYDLASLLIGSEGTLGIVTGAWLRLMPAPEGSAAVMALYPDLESGCAAVETVMASGIQASALEYLDGGALQAARAALPGTPLPDAGFMVLAEADGSAAEVDHAAAELVEALGPGSIELREARDRAALTELWRWRDGVSIAVEAHRGGKLSEDVGVGVDRLAEAVRGTVEIGEAHGLTACSWGHAGDGNLHATFMVDVADADEIARAERACEDLFALAIRLGGTISGEHGLGLVKGGQLERQWSPATYRLHTDVKRLLDPKGLINPGKKR